MDYLKLLKDLSEISGVSGNEKKVAKYIEEVLKDENLEKTNCNLGSQIYIKNKNVGPKIMLAAHMDEVGLMVREITDKGFLKVQPIGGWYSQVMLSQKWLVETKNGDEVIAITGSTPPHILSKEIREKPVDISCMYLDLGLSDKKEVEKLGISIGSFVCPMQKFYKLANNDFLLGKAWDNRIGTAVLIAVAKRLNNVLDKEVDYTFTVQEEVGLRGAQTASYHINPDIAIAIDSGLATDLPGNDNPQGEELGKGPQIIFYDGGLIPNQKLKEKVIKVAKENNIKYQLSYLSGGQTDAARMQYARSGAAVISILVPARYIHSHTSVISYSDFLETVNLVEKLILSLDKKEVSNILKF